MSLRHHVEESIAARGRHAFRAIVTLAAVVLLGVWQAGSAQMPPEATDAALRAFAGRVEAYVRLHERMEARLPVLETGTHSLSRLLSRGYLATAIRAARQHAKEGDTFTPDVADLFRARLAEGMAGRDIAISPPDDEGWPVAVVNEPFAEEASHAVPAFLLQELPPLPGGIEYRRLGADLVLWDVHADIVIDVLVDAFRAPSHV